MVAQNSAFKMNTLSSRNLPVFETGNLTPQAKIKKGNLCFFSLKIPQKAYILTVELISIPQKKCFSIHYVSIRKVKTYLH